MANFIKNTLQFIKRRWQNFAYMFPSVAKWLRRGGKVLFIIFIMDVGYLIGIWPEWKWYSEGSFPKSQFILQYEREHSQDPTTPGLHWNPVSIEQIPKYMVVAVLAAEDSRFFKHDGFDTKAFMEAMEYNWERKQFIYGASTLTQQTTKNLFLTPSRNPLRKWHELVLTVAMEKNLTKKRIMEIYLNIAEFGKGIYGIEAAAQHYWGVSARDISVNQALELAATLPAPKKHNPATRTSFFKKHKKKIKRNAGL